MLKRRPSVKRKGILIFPTANDANGFLNLFRRIIKNEKILTLADFYFLIGIKPSDEDWNTGWTNDAGMDVREMIFSKRHKLILPRLNYDRREE